MNVNGPTVSVFVLICCVACILFRVIYGRGYDRWIPSYLRRAAMRRTSASRPREIHVLLCIADHFEPGHGGATGEAALARVNTWVREYPARFGAFQDSDGRSPRHTFFYPIEMYVPEHLDLLATLCRAGHGEVELHLHHDDDTAENLRATLLGAVDELRTAHGVFASSRRDGRAAYAFVHGNWALDNSRPDGKWCGVNNELDVLRETGCYADFTFPSAPSRTQPRKINSIYYAVDDPERPRSHDHGLDVGAGRPPADSLMIIQGPLLLDWKRRRWGLVPGTENGCLQSSQPPHIDRLELWLKAGVRVPARPDWFFVKLHAHGAPEESHEALLGAPMVQFHQALANRSLRDPAFHYHYVTAREMYNLAKAAEAGWTGSVAEALDYQLVWQPQPCGDSVPASR